VRPAVLLRRAQAKVGKANSKHVLSMHITAEAFCRALCKGSNECYAYSHKATTKTCLLSKENTATKVADTAAHACTRMHAHANAHRRTPSPLAWMCST